MGRQTHVVTNQIVSLEREGKERGTERDRET